MSLLGVSMKKPAALTRVTASSTVGTRWKSSGSDHMVTVTSTTGTVRASAFIDGQAWRSKYDLLSPNIGTPHHNLAPCDDNTSPAVRYPGLEIEWFGGAAASAPTWRAYGSS